MATPIPSPGSGVRAALRPSIPAITLAVLAATCSGLAGIAAIWGIVSMIANPSPAAAALTGAAWVVGAALASFASWLAHTAEARFEARLRRDVAVHLLRMPADRLTAYPADTLRRLVADDVAALHHMVAHLPGEVAALIAVPAAAAISLLTLAGPAALLALIPGALAGFGYLAVIPRLSARHGSERARVMGEITTAVDDYARGIHVFRSFGAEQGALSSYRNATHRFTTGMVAWVRRVATPAAFAVALLQAAASYAIAYAVGADSDPATLAATLLFSLALVAPALRLGHGLDYVAAGRAAATRVDGLLVEPTIVTGKAGPPRGGGVTADALSVRLGGHTALDLPAFAAPSGAITAVTGPSGAGKSTLLRVLAGLQQADTGQVWVCGTPLAELSEAARTQSVLLIPQGLAALSDTVRENLRLVAPDADDHRYAQALKRAQLHTSLAADASLFSDGERQRLALARAFLTTTKVILLDEPTSALDDATAHRLWHELTRWAQDEDRTVVVVTHDTSLAARAAHHCRITAAARVQEGTHL